MKPKKRVLKEPQKITKTPIFERQGVSLDASTTNVPERIYRIFCSTFGGDHDDWCRVKKTGPISVLTYSVELSLANSTLPCEMTDKITKVRKKSGRWGQTWARARVLPRRGFWFRPRSFSLSFCALPPHLFRSKHTLTRYK